MIIVDLETSGLNPEEHGIWQIGALEFENPRNNFLDEARIDNEDKISEEALVVIGKTKEYLKDKRKQSQKELIEKFFRWIEKINIKTLVTQNPQFDCGFLTMKARKYNLKIPFGHRMLDLHTLGVLKYLQINKKFLIEDGKSSMNLPKIIEYCGMKDTRVQLKDGKLIQDGSPHNALEDAKIEAECFSRLINGKNLIKEFDKFQIPNYLKNMRFSEEVKN